MAVNASAVKELREKTGAGMLDCKKALEEANGEISKAIEVLREKGLAAAANKAGRTATEGVCEAYIHAGAVSAYLLKSTVKLTSLVKQISSKSLRATLQCTSQLQTLVM